MTGVYSIAEVTDDSNKKPEKTIFCFLNTDKNDDNEELKFTKAQIKSLESVSKMIKKNGGQWFSTLSEISNYLNKQK
jgi:hypothetical protein